MRDERLLAHYALAFEQRRHVRGRDETLEFERSYEIVTRYLPTPPASVLDIGGGPGVYAARLAASGYRVKVVDIVPLHIEQARALSATAKTSFDAMVGDACELDEVSGSWDCSLLLGPLYHLQERDERLAALREAARVTSRGGTIIVQALSRFSPLINGIRHRALSDASYRNAVAIAVQTGCYENPMGLARPEWFTTAYCHTVAEFLAELAEARLEAVEIVGVEGPGWYASKSDDPPEWREALVWAAQLVEANADALNLSSSYFALCRVAAA